MHSTITLAWQDATACGTVSIATVGLAVFLERRTPCMAIKALIVGGAGFIGTALVRRLSQAGVAPTIFDCCVPAERLHPYVEGDVRDV